MSILDGMISSEQQLRDVMGEAGRQIDQILSQAEINPRAQSIFDLMGEGLSLADILDISKEERDALFIQGVRFFQVGEHQKAQDILMRLSMLEPTDERPIYVLGASFQMQGDFAKAGKLYVQFLALDATNPNGYLRLGECFLANGEVKEAHACFGTALDLANSGHGGPDAAAQAEKMLQAAAARLSPN